MEKLKKFFNPAHTIATYLLIVIIVLLIGILKIWPEKIFETRSVVKSDSTFILSNPDSSMSVIGDFKPSLRLLLNDSAKVILRNKSQDSILINTTVKLVPKSAPFKEILLLWLVLIVGALGSSLHGIISISNYIGSSSFKETWSLWYILRPFVGAILSLIFYLIIRAGLFNEFDTSTDFYTIIALSGLIGLFSKQALNKLSEIFDALFSSSKEAKLPDKIGSNPVPNIGSVSPDTLSKAESDIELTINGSDFIGDSIVRINNKDYKPIFNSSKQLLLKLPTTDIQTLDTIQIGVFNPPPEGGLSNIISVNITD